MPVTKIPVGGYAAIAVSGNFANLRAAVLVELDKFIALIIGARDMMTTPKIDPA